MANIEPLKAYLAATDSPDDQQAAELLTRALGGPEPSPTIRNNVRLLLTPDTRANDAVLTILSSEIAKRR